MKAHANSVPPWHIQHYRGRVRFPNFFVTNRATFTDVGVLLHSWWPREWQQKGQIPCRKLRQQKCQRAINSGQLVIRLAVLKRVL